MMTQTLPQIIHADANKRASIRCPQCQTKRLVKVAKYGGIYTPVKVRCPCTALFYIIIDSIDFFRKAVCLGGSYSMNGGTTHYPTMLSYFSPRGLGLSAHPSTNLEVGDTLEIRCLLEQTPWPEFIARVMVTHVHDGEIEAEFCEGQANEEVLKYYLGGNAVDPLENPVTYTIPMEIDTQSHFSSSSKEARMPVVPLFKGVATPPPPAAPSQDTKAIQEVKAPREAKPTHAPKVPHEPGIVPASKAEHDSKLLALLKLPWHPGGEHHLEKLFDMLMQWLVETIPDAMRCALLLRDRNGDQLLLKAHLPAGTPAVSLTLAQQALTRRQGFIWRLGENGGNESQTGMETLAGMYVPLLWKNEAFGVLCVDNRLQPLAFNDDDLQMLQMVAQYLTMAIVLEQQQDDLRRETNMRESLLRQFSPKIAERWLQHYGRKRLGGERSEVTILCADMRGFTSLSKNMEPDDVVDMLNDYFAHLIPVIFAHDGTVDKYMGDAILAVFGSPEPDPRQHEKALHAALEMQQAMAVWKASRESKRQVSCDIGIGIHCGEVLHGFVGVAERMEFTVIGEAVNRASRYSDGAGPGEILISPAVYEHVWRLVEAEPSTIATKHEGDLAAFRVTRLRPLTKESAT